MWLNRAGVEAVYFGKFLAAKRVFLPWSGYRENLANFRTREDFKKLVVQERGEKNRTTISNWAGMMYAFAYEMKVGEYVLIPTKHSKTYMLGIISGEYEYNRNDEDGLYHSRKIDIIIRDIPRAIFPQSIVYSLGAFRTVFKVKNEDDILQIINTWERGKADEAAI